MIDPFKDVAGRQKRGRPTIGVLASWQLYAGTINTLLSPIVQGVYRAALDFDCNVLIAGGVVSSFAPETRPAWPFLSPEVDFVPVGPWNTDGLIVIAPHQGSEGIATYLEQVMARNHPVVFVESAENRPVISPDNANGIFQALAHLKEHGHKRLAFVAGGPGWPGDSQERLQAFLEGCEELGLETDQRLMAYGGFSTPGGYQAMHQILSSGIPFTGLVAANDESAVGAIQALRAAGLRVPQDVAVIGFDNRFESRNQSPLLTTIDQPAYDIGYQALKLMVHRLRGQADESTMVRVPARLIIRESCGCPRDAIITHALADLEQSEAKHNLSLVTQRLIQTMSEAVFAGVGQLQRDEILAHCERITDGFVASLQQRNPQPFQSALAETLRPIRLLDEDAHAWQNAITALRYWWPALVAPGEAESHREAVDAWLDQARITISECAQAQLLRYFARQDTLTQQLSMMAAELAETLELSQIQKVINQYLPALSVAHAQVVLLEADDGNPVGWSVLPDVPEDQSSFRRFPTQEFPPRHRYPEEQPFHLALLPLTVHKKPAGFVAFDAANLSPCLAMLRQLASALERIRLYQEVAEGRRLAEEADRMKSRFLSTVSHELRTPLNLIISLSEMQLRQSTADMRRSVEKIHTNAQHLSHLIRDVLDLASSDAGQLRLTCEPLDLVEALQSVVETGKQLAGDKGLLWRTEIEDALPRVWGDRTRLQQVTLNLVSNAVKFTSHGGVTLRLYREGQQVVIAVQDTGLGIPADEQPWIFNEFRQSERTTARGYGGLGLGLAICKRLVELHHGEIGVQSSGEEDVGSTFFIRLPILENGQESSPIMQPTLQQIVLILTENERASQPIRERLQSQGFRVQIEIVDETSSWFSRVLTSPPGAVVLEDQIASKCGWELLRVLKGNPQTEDIPVLFYSLQPDENTGMMLALDYLAKPISSSELLKILARQGLDKNTRGQSKTILIADDEPGYLNMYAEMVRSLSKDYCVLTARNGREALDLLRKTHVDLVLLDLMMPEVDGFGVLAQMREWESTRETAVVVLTSKTLTESDMARLSHGVANVMSKGMYDVREMLTHVGNALSRHKKLGTESQRLVRRAMAYIHEHYAGELTRDDLAQHVNASEGHLARCFRQETGMTPMAYLNRYRVNQAKTLLTTTNRSITSVALAVGFSDNNYFSRVFRQEVGCSPLAYRREHKV